MSASVAAADLDRRVQIIAGAGRDDRSIERVSDLRAQPFVVLLGEPGIGKSTVLSREAAHEGTTAITVRALMTGTEPAPDAALFLDALDEYRTDGGAEDKVHLLANAIARCNRPRWRLTCRAEDWRKAADIGPIRKAVSGQPVTVAQLLPLDAEEAVAVLAALGELNPKGFVANAEAYGATALIESPLALRLLRSAVADGGAWPVNRFELFASATRKLAFERNAVRNVIERHGVDQILGAAGNAFLLLLLSGARAVWRSNNEPPSSRDARAYVLSHDLQFDRGLLDDMLDTPLFRGEGEAFEPIHKTIAEFLAAKALATAVVASPLPFDRALALTTGDDASPPTELRGLFAWFAAHLAVAGDAASTLRLVRSDPVIVLNYGDAAVLETSARRELLHSLEQADPYFRAYEVGPTAVGGLAGEDLASEFSAILAEPEDGIHRLLTVLEALTIGRPVSTLRSQLRALVLDASRPEWVRRRAIAAYLNGLDHPSILRRELFDALSTEPPSVGREAIRAELAAGFSPGALTVADLRSVLACYRRSRADNMMGRLYGLLRRIETEPMPELFDEPIATWLSERNDGGGDHGIEVNQFLDYALASSIRNAEFTAPRLWRWLTNVRRDRWSPLKDQTRRALDDWLAVEPERELALFDAVLDTDNAALDPWFVASEYAFATQRAPSAALVQHLLTRASGSGAPRRQRLVAIAVEIAVTTKNEAVYWATYGLVERTGDDALLRRLTVSQVDPWRRDDANRRAERLAQEELERAEAVQVLSPILSDLAVGRYPQNHAWAAEKFFALEGEPTVERVVRYTDAITAEAIVAGWSFLATHGLGDIDAAELGKAEAERRWYYVEAAAVAGIYRLINEGTLLPLDAPTEVALAVLKSSFTANGEGRRKILDRWAIARLDAEPVDGTRQLVRYWNAAIDAGAEELPSIWQLQGEGVPSGVMERALRTFLTERPALSPNVLRTALRASAKVLDKVFLIGAARSASENTEVGSATRNLWRLTAWVLNPNSAVDLEQSTLIDLFLDDANSELIEALSGMVEVDGLPATVLRIRAFGSRASPRDDSSTNGRVLAPQRRSENVRHSINALSADNRLDAAQALAELANSPDLIEWRAAIRHAQAQQRRLMRDHNFRHPTPAAVLAALYCGPPVNASDLRAVVAAELKQLRDELRTTDTQSWKKYWNRDRHGKVTEPLIENECRDHLLERLRDRLGKYQIAAALPEARRGEETRADMLMLTGAGRNLPLEAKRHFHPDLWVAASTQLQGYAAAPGADGQGIYLVFWFGNGVRPAPARSDGLAGPSSGAELEQMLSADLAGELRGRTDVLVFDVSASTLDKKHAKTMSRGKKRSTTVR